MNDEELVPLKLLASGQTAKVGQLVGRPEEVHRLEELGLRRGVAIEMVQPGSPCIIRVAGAKLCFRDNEAFSVLVHVGEAE